jgi:hypothetical protein
MRKMFLTLTSLFFLGSFISAHAQEKSLKKQPATTQKSAASVMPDSAAMMQAWSNYMTPGKMHEMIAKDNGTWNEEVTMWMDPSAPPTKSTATVVNTMILGGRYQQSQHNGNFNGMPFEGVSMLGYDNAKKVFVTTWADNMGTGIMSMEGKWDEGTKTVVFKGKSVDPATGKDMNVKETFKKIDDNTQMVEMFNIVGGKEIKTMEIKLTRKM